VIANFVAWAIDHPRQGVAAVLTLWGYAVIGVAGVCWRWRVWEASR
jgi:hypothetical protein